MKLIERKCPNCGANLSFNEDDKTCRCEYCKREFDIEKDAKDEFNLIAGQIGNEVVKSMKMGRVLLYIFLGISAIMFCFVTIMIFTHMNGKESTPKTKKESGYVTKIDQISNFDMNFMDGKSVFSITAEDSNTVEFHANGLLTRDSLYLLTKKDGNILIPVYTIKYSNGETSYTLYIPVEYKNIQKNSLSVDLGLGDIPAPVTYFNLEHSEFHIGYQDMETLEKEVIDPLKEEGYSVEKK